MLLEVLAVLMDVMGIYIYTWASRLECAMRANSIQVYCLLAILMFYWKLQGILSGLLCQHLC
jgi:hypothetical protein